MMRVSQPSVRLGPGHCCVCAGVCHHIGPVRLCDKHGPTEDAFLDRLARALVRDSRILRRLV